MMPSFNKVLVVAAHPDDEILGCGGTIALLTEKGSTVRIVILGEGLTSREGSASNEEFEALHADCYNACNTLGVNSLKLYSFPDNKFDSVPLLEIVKTVESECNAFLPNLILTHHVADLNIDHVLTHRAVLTATRPVNSKCTSCIWAFETPSATEWAFGLPPFLANTFVDISATLETKVAAMSYYRNESRSSPHPRSSESLRALSYVRGAAAGCQAAEAFSVVRQIYRV